MGIYLNQNKLGYEWCSVTPARGLKGGGVRVRSVTWVRAGTMGFVQEQRVESDEQIGRDLRPLRKTVHMISGGKRVEIQARFHADYVEVERRDGSNAAHLCLPVPGSGTLAANTDVILRGCQLEVGQTLRYYFLNVVTLAFEEAVVRLLRRETQPIDGEEQEVLVIQTSSETVEGTEWLLPNGEPLKRVVHPGVTMVRETREETLSGLDSGPYHPERDVAAQLAAPTTGTVIAAGRTSFLRLRVRGIPDRRFVLSDGWQQATVEEDRVPLTVEYLVRSKSVAAPMPLSSEERATLLASSPYLPAHHPEITRVAREVAGRIGDEHDRVLALWRWVHGLVRIRGDFGIPRTALDVLRDPVGVCRDHATLYTALARAAGLPTRACAGIMYFGDRFYYHTWAESYANGNWIAVDTTVVPGGVDANRIKFVQGDITAMYRAVRIIGKLAVEVLDQG